VQWFSKVSACRRMLNSHDAASRENRAASKSPRCSAFGPEQRGIGRTGPQQAQQAVECGESKASDWQPQCQVGSRHGVGTLCIQSVRRATEASSCAGFTCAQRWLRNVASQGHERGAGNNWSTATSAARSRLVRSVASHGASRPNPSLKLSPNGGPRGPRRLYLVHSRQPGPRVPPLVPT
jgi:hypothetical protein